MRLSLAPLLRVLLYAGGVGSFLFFLIFLGQRRMLYLPDRQPIASAERRAAGLGLKPWRSAGRFLGWKAPHPSGSPRGRLIVLHGNAGSALDRIYLRDAFQAPGLEPVDVYLCEYPGYGPRPGRPSQTTLVDAALEAVRVAQSDGPGTVILVGESLGSAVAALAAAAEPSAVAGLFLVTPLSSVGAVARRHFGAVPDWLLRDRYAADEALPRYPGPVAFLIAGRDEVVFPDLGLSLFEARHGPGRLWLDAQADHNSVDFDPRLPRWGEVLSYLLGSRDRATY